MTIARKQQISLEQTRYYHCTSRCVRRAFLCGKDRATGRNFEHRRHWIEERLKLLQSVFAMDLVAYAVMNDHYHVVLRVNVEEAQSWDAAEVANRWKMIFRGPVDASIAEDEIILWRERLQDISWFMRCINERIARNANREDGCKGRFWEGRYRLQALLDERAVLTCMTYVDLNPIRAGIAILPEKSAHTSIKARIERNDGHLLPLKDDRRNTNSGPDIKRNNRDRLEISREDYLLLVDWSGRVVRRDKRGYIPAESPPILKRLNLSEESWNLEIRHYRTWYYRAVGSIFSLEAYCQHLGQQWLKGMGRLSERALARPSKYRLPGPV